MNTEHSPVDYSNPVMRNMVDSAVMAHYCNILDRFKKNGRLPKEGIRHRIIVNGNVNGEIVSGTPEQCTDSERSKIRAKDLHFGITHGKNGGFDIREIPVKTAGALDKGSKDESIIVPIGLSLAPVAVANAVSLPVTRNNARSKDISTLLVSSDVKKNPAAAIVESIKVDGVPIRKYLKDRGIALHSSTTFGKDMPGPTFIPKDTLVGMRDDLGNSLTGALGRKAKGAVLLGFKHNTPASSVVSTAGHELGHAVRLLKNPDIVRRYQRSKKLSLILGGVGSVCTASKDSGAADNAAWIAGTALSSLPMLHEEIQASRIGSKLVGLKGLARLRSFKGVPSYLVAAGSPAIALGARKLYDKLTKKSEERPMNKVAHDIIMDRVAGMRKQAAFPRISLGRALSRYGQLLRGDSDVLIPYRLSHNMVRGLGGLFGKFGVKSLQHEARKTLLAHTIETLLSKGDIPNELRKIYATRAATAGAGGLALLGILPDSENASPAEKGSAMRKQAMPGPIKAVGRYLQLLAGGSRKATEELRNARRMATAPGKDYGGMLGKTRFNLASLFGRHSARAYKDALSDLNQGAKALNSGNDSIVKDLFMSAGNTQAQAMRLRRGESEAREVLAARLGTAGAIGGGMYAANAAEAVQE